MVPGSEVMTLGWGQYDLIVKMYYWSIFTSVLSEITHALFFMSYCCEKHCVGHGEEGAFYLKEGVGAGVWWYIWPYIEHVFLLTVINVCLLLTIFTSFWKLHNKLLLDDIELDMCSILRDLLYICAS